MSNFLAVDTSGNHLAVVAVKDGTTYATYVENCAMKHAVSIMPAVDETLKKANLQLKDCDFFAAVVGAGSFTGIRIGISTVKGFCLAHGKPALAITSFDVAAYNALDTKTNKILCLVDALHDCYYACGYENGSCDNELSLSIEKSNKGKDKCNYEAYCEQVDCKAVADIR
jgi:tRNA threonylcarbamoyl adenosine modification protein YeaZ